MSFFQKIFQSVDQRYIFLAISISSCLVGFGIGKLFYEAPTVDVSSQIAEIKASYEKQISDMKAALETERARHEVNVKKLEEDLSTANAQYEDAKDKLAKKKSDEVKKILQRYDGNPEIGRAHV